MAGVRSENPSVMSEDVDRVIGNTERAELIFKRADNPQLQQTAKTMGRQYRGYRRDLNQARSLSR